MKRSKGNVTAWLNVFKTSSEEDAAPDYRGKITVDGKDYEISLWIDRSIHDLPIKLSGQISSPK